MNMEDVMAKSDAAAKSTPWLHDLIKSDGISLLKMKGDIKKFFEIRFPAFFTIATALKLTQIDGSPVTEAHHLPGIDGNMEILFAIYVQNLLQPKNNNRRDAVANKTYV